MLKQLLSLALLQTIFIAENRQLIFDYKSHMIPHPDKAHRGGEDAFFDSQKMLVVADGVGGWNDQGIDPSKYSRFLCERAGQLLKENQRSCLTQPNEVIKKAHKDNQNLGSSTIVVATLDGENLRICYLGDSGVIVIRKYDNQLLSIYQFVEHQHGFNFPFQLHKDEQMGDVPEDSICLSIEIKQGDIVVVGSDGLFDNVSFNEVLAGVRMGEEKGLLLSGLPEMLAKLAIERGQNKKFNSPFAKRAKELGLEFQGGKLDDTTVIIARIIEQKQRQEQQQL